jgi:hypothetical protein
MRISNKEYRPEIIGMKQISEAEVDAEMQRLRRFGNYK